MKYDRHIDKTEEALGELIRKIEATVKNMSLRELEALYYELSTKSFANDNIAL
jgi:hypothetical protein